MSKEMKLLFFSDTHSREDLLHPPTDDISVVFHTGDITENAEGNLEELKKALGYFDRFYHHVPHKILIAGNHDFALGDSHTSKEAEALLKQLGWTYLKDSGTVLNIEGHEISIWGMPYMPPSWGVFNSPDKERIKHIEHIPFGTEILLTHSGPYGILSSGIRGIEFGDELLLDRLPLLKPKLHAFGHVHESRGFLETESTLFVNSAIGTLYKKPIVVSWPSCTVIS